MPLPSVCPSRASPEERLDQVPKPLAWRDLYPYASVAIGRVPATHITGLDSSTAMIEKARQTSDAIDWRIGDIQTWCEPNRFDLIFANASLHWIDDHESMTKRLLEAVKPSGIFAFQMPALYNQPVAQAIHDVSESPAWKSHRLSDRYTLLTHTPGEYYDWHGGCGPGHRRRI